MLIFNTRESRGLTSVIASYARSTCNAIWSSLSRCHQSSQNVQAHCEDWHLEHHVGDLLLHGYPQQPQDKYPQQDRSISVDRTKQRFTRISSASRRQPFKSFAWIDISFMTRIKTWMSLWSCPAPRLNGAISLTQVKSTIRLQLFQLVQVIAKRGLNEIHSHLTSGIGHNNSEWGDVNSSYEKLRPSLQQKKTQKEIPSTTRTRSSSITGSPNHAHRMPSSFSSSTQEILLDSQGLQTEQPQEDPIHYHSHRLPWNSSFSGSSSLAAASLRTQIATVHIQPAQTLSPTSSLGNLWQIFTTTSRSLIEQKEPKNTPNIDNIFWRTWST